MQSKATSVEQYLAELPEDRRAAIGAVRDVILDNLDAKCCVRFRKLEDVALDVVAEALRRVPAKKYIAQCESVRQSMNRPASKRASAARPPVKTSKSAARAKTQGRARDR